MVTQSHPDLSLPSTRRRGGHRSPIEKQLPVSHQTVYAAVTRPLTLHLVGRRVVEPAISITQARVLSSAAPTREQLSSGIGKEAITNNEDDQHRPMPSAGRASRDTGLLYG